MHALGGDEVEEAAEVEAALGAEGAADRLVRVPGDVGLDGVQAHQPRLADAVGPEVGVHPEVVQRAGQDPVRPSVELEVGGADGEAALGCGGHDHPSDQEKRVVREEAGRSDPAGLPWGV
ncbi:hypothetical protein ASF46_00905 [Rathayibacter sp. Leaf296]|nr:hypothetical protein ASF46_00905 [Rathayibacter sp. Leaf296]